MYHYGPAGNLLGHFGVAGHGVECAEHPEPEFAPCSCRKMALSSCITPWFDDNLKAHSVDAGEGTDESPSHKGVLDWKDHTYCQAGGDSIPLCSVWLPVAALPPWETSPISKRLSKEEHFWQPSGSGRSLLTCSSTGICYGCHCPLLPSPCQSPACLPVQQLGTACGALAFPLQTISHSCSPVPTSAYFYFTAS